MIPYSPPCQCQHLQTAHDGATGTCGYCSCNRFRDSSSQYSSELRCLGDFALEAARRDLEKTGSVRPFFVLRFPDNHLDTVRLPMDYVPLMNDSEGRSRIYASIRAMTQMLGVTAVITAGDAWFGRSTEKGRQLSEAEFIRICGQNNGFAYGVALGLVERTEGIVVTAQTAERVMTLMQAYKRSGTAITYEEQLVSEVDTDRMYGPLRMFEPKGRKGAAAHASN